MARPAKRFAAPSLQHSASLQHWFHASNAGGNVATLVDASNGSICARYDYGPFGESVRATGLMADLNPVRFSTKYTDPESGLLYYGYRYCNPSTGRWLSRDPVGEGGGLALYSQGANDAVNFVDELGLWIVHRRGARRALVTAECDGESIYVLAKRVGLDPREAPRWLRAVGAADANRVRARDEFTIPNTVLIVLGKTGLLTRKVVLERMANYGAVRMAASGFHVVYLNREIIVFGTDQVVSQADTDLWGFAFLGHGTVMWLKPELGGDFKIFEGQIVRPEDMMHIPVQRYDYGFGLAYLCSAPFANWGQLVSYNGVFYGSTWYLEWVGHNEGRVRAAFDEASRK